MKRKNSFIKSMLLTLISLIVGFFAIALPFNLFRTLTDESMQMIFISEIVIYFAIAMLFLVFTDKKKKEKIKCEKWHEERRAKIQRVQREWIDIAA